LTFSLGAGTSLSGPANTWAAAGYQNVTGAVSVIGTLNATWYITGVQLEEGLQATPFEYRQYTTELQLCQRYAVKYGGNATYETIGPMFVESSTSALLIMYLPVVMRTVPSVAFSTLRVIENQGASVAITKRPRVWLASQFFCRNGSIWTLGSIANTVA
jgi:hypothetical protein